MGRMQKMCMMGYKSHIISTIVDTDDTYYKNWFGYKSHIISTIVDAPETVIGLGRL